MKRQTASRARPSAPSAIALVGFMGAGKTTVGQLLATRLSWHFLDLDDLVRARDGRSIAQIFEQSGESQFRELERDVLAEAVRISLTQPSVLSLGGGAFIDNTNRELLRENGIRTVFLDAPVEELFRRCSQPGVVRPLLRDRQRFVDLYAQRRPVYSTAALSIQTSGLQFATIVEEIISRLGLESHWGASQ
jgi:shikimate kinase